MAMNYSDKVIDHYMHPRNVGEIENPRDVYKRQELTPFLICGHGAPKPPRQRLKKA